MADANPCLTRRSAVLGVPNLLFIEKLGEGGMAVVWKAWDTVNQRLVAVKVLNEESSRNPADVKKFREEEQHLEEIRDPGVVEAYDFGSANGRWYMVMEYIDGYSFADLLKRKGRVSEEDCLLICESLSRSLARIWSGHGIVHCDIKPDNIMINTDGIVKLTDMGISYRYQYLGDRADMLSEVVGTPAYISPEQVCGDVELDCRADIYSLGATLYHLSTGRLLFPDRNSDDSMIAHCDNEGKAQDPRLIEPWLSDSFVKMLEYMLVKDRDHRISSWEMLYEICSQVERKVRFKSREDLSPSTLDIPK